MIVPKRFIGTFVLTCLAAMLMAPSVADAKQLVSKTVASGETWVVPETTRLHVLTIDEGGIVAAPPGYSLTMTVNGVETGQVLATTAGVNTRFAAGTYRGDIVLTVAEANPVAFSAGPGAPQVFPFRQALYLDATGIVADKSVLAAVIGKKPSGFSIENILISSTGDDFNGIYAAGGSHKVKNVKMNFRGDGRSDFAGYGAAIEGTGANTNLVVDGAQIFTHGVVRTGVVATGGSNVVVKNSNIYSMQGVLPADHQQTVDQTQMRSAPWMLGINGFDNVRATNLLGPSTKASYISSSIGSDSWGTLSTDSGSNCTLTAINSKISNRDGYGSYVIGNATEHFLGDEFDVGGYVTINTGGAVYYGDSTHQAVAQLNTDLGLGLSGEELASLGEKHTIINSKRFGVMWHNSSGTADVSGGTIFNTAEASFLDKSSQAVTITVDGSKGAQLNPANGIIMQVMDDDDPGPQPPNMLNAGVYVEPTTEPRKDHGFDVTSTANAATAIFSNIALVGNFYNSSGWTLMPGGGPLPPLPGGGPAPGPTSNPGEQNMALTFNHASIVGVITSSKAHHYPCSSPCTIDSTKYMELGEVINTPCAAINNGVIVSLTNGSKWTVTGASHLTKLAITVDSSITAPAGHNVSMTVDGNSAAIVPGTTYTGAIMLTID